MRRLCPAWLQAAAALVLTAPVPAEAAQVLEFQTRLHFDATGEGRLLPCAPKTSCVSTANFLSPSQYLAPWTYDPTPREQARKRLREELLARGGRVVAEDDARGYLAAVVPYTLGPGRQDEDVLEFKFADTAVAFRSEARTNVPPPPFCWTPGCISGPANRQRLEALRDALGWPAQETDEDKKWVQILLH